MGPGEDEIARIQVRRVLLLGGTRASIGRLVAAAAVLALLLAGLPGGGSAAVRASLYTPNPTVTGVTPTTAVQEIEPIADPDDDSDVTPAEPQAPKEGDQILIKGLEAVRKI